MDANSSPPHVKDSCNSSDKMQLVCDSINSANKLSSEQQTSLSGQAASPKVHIVLDKDSLERKKVILIVPRGSQNSKLQLTNNQKAFMLRQASNNEIESILQQSFNTRTLASTGQATCELKLDPVKPPTCLQRASTSKETSIGLAPSTNNQTTSSVQISEQSTSLEQPAAQSTSLLQQTSNDQTKSIIKQDLIGQMNSLLHQAVKGQPRFILQHPSSVQTSTLVQQPSNVRFVALQQPSKGQPMSLQQPNKLQHVQQPSKGQPMSMQLPTKLHPISLQLSTKLQHVQNPSRGRPPSQNKGASNKQKVSRVQIASYVKQKPVDQGSSLLQEPSHQQATNGPTDHPVERSTSLPKAFCIKKEPSDEVGSLKLQPSHVRPVSLVQIVRNEQTAPSVYVASNVQTSSIIKQNLRDRIESRKLQFVQAQPPFPVHLASGSQPFGQSKMTPKLTKTKAVAKRKKKSKTNPKLPSTRKVPHSDGTVYLPGSKESKRNVPTFLQDSMDQESVSGRIQNPKPRSVGLKTSTMNSEELDESSLTGVTGPSPSSCEVVGSDDELDDAYLSSDEEIPAEDPSDPLFELPSKVKKPAKRKSDLKNKESEGKPKRKRKSKADREKDDGQSQIPKSRKQEIARMVRFDTQSLYDFVIEEKTENEFICRNCKNIFVTKEEAVSHMYIHHPFKCYICSETFRDHCSLPKHLQDVHEIVQHCTNCSFTTHTMLKLKKHFKEVHGDRKCFTLKHAEMCHLCGVLVRTRVLMDKHMTEVHGVEASLREGELVCPRCNNVSSSLTAFNIHCMKHKGTFRLCKFEGCSFKHVLQCFVDKHYEQIHCGVRSFDCPHEGCSYKAKTSSMLNNHTSSYHSKVRNFHCPSCPKAFFNSKHLAVHKRIHDDVKPIACKHCEYRCRQKAALNWHMDKHHPEFVEVKAKVNYEQEPGVEASKHHYKPGRKRRKEPKGKNKTPE